MDFWTERIKEVEIYVKTENEENLEKIILHFVPYLKKSAEYSHFSACNTGVYIPFEEFYSSYLVATWKAVKDFLNNENGDLNFKNLFLHRLFIAEKNVWRMYKRNSGKSTDKNGVTYASGRWQSIDENEVFFSPTFLDESVLMVKEILNKYRLIAPNDAQFFSLLVEGYSCAEAVRYIFFEEYNARMRKKIERMKRKFKVYLENEYHFSFYDH